LKPEAVWLLIKVARAIIAPEKQVPQIIPPPEVQPR
jgi:hypothetical protein